MALRITALVPGSREWLEQAVAISLFTDARLPPGEKLPVGDTDRQGHWGDAFLTADESLGSLLWTLRREKLTPAIVNRARDLAVAALRWLLGTTYITAFDVTVERYAPANDSSINYWTLALRVTLSLPDQSTLTTTELLNAA